MILSELRSYFLSLVSKKVFCFTSSFLQHSIFPYEVTMLTRVLALLPFPHVDGSIIARIEAVMPQCSLKDLNTICLVVAKWIRNNPSSHHNTPSKYVRLLQGLKHCGRERLRTADRLDLLLEELKYASGEWVEEIMIEDIIETLKRMMDQINWTNVPELALFLTRINHLSPPLMERIANISIKDIEKVSNESDIINNITEQISVLILFSFFLRFTTLRYTPFCCHFPS